jgi:hypothetical protein
LAALGPKVFLVVGSRVGVGLGERWAPLGLGGLVVSGADLEASRVGGLLALGDSPLG